MCPNGNRTMSDNFQFINLIGISENDKAGKKAGIAAVNHQMLRRTCSTYMSKLTDVKDVQAHLRHSSAKTTLEHYIQSVPESVRVAVESLDLMLKRIPSSEKLVN